MEVLLVGPIRQYGILVLFGLLYLIERILGFWLLIPVRERGTRVRGKVERRGYAKLLLEPEIGNLTGEFDRP